jgi:iron complex outermembrane recepter protein
MFALASPAEAQTSRVSEDVVVTATVAPTSIQSIGQPVTIFTREEFERLGLISVVDALRLAPGVDVRARGPRDVQSDVSVRGATFGQSLILVDGFRVNDRQSAHHNGDIPMAVAGLERIEVVSGAGSTVHGADALGGTINIITRRDPHATGSLALGQHGYFGVQASASGILLPSRWSTTGWASRSSGFTFDRDFATGGAAIRGNAGRGWVVDFRHQRKAFGANGFYGASPSKEWTDQTLGAATWRRARGRWITEVRTAWRNHGDHFRWDIARPGFAENEHRTDSAELTVGLDRDLGIGRRLSVGGGTGGDRVRSSNLGDRNDVHQHAYAELLLPLGARSALTTGLRLDNYSGYGRAWSPAASIATRVAPPIKLRASVRRAFRIPTFTELYYHDPANLGSPDLRAEYGWSFDAGLDWTPDTWTISLSPFARWDRDVIDWVRPTAADLWRSTNVRDVSTRGVEVSLARQWAGAMLRGYFSRQSVDAPALSVLSKYVLEYARHSVGASIAVPIGPRLQAAMNVDWRDRLDGQRYALVAVRLTRTIGHAQLFVDATNLLNARYQEVAGVEMPGRWASAGVLFR